MTVSTSWYLVTAQKPWLGGGSGCQWTGSCSLSRRNASWGNASTKKSWLARSMSVSSTRASRPAPGEIFCYRMISQGKPAGRARLLRQPDVLGVVGPGRVDLEPLHLVRVRIRERRVEEGRDRHIVRHLLLDRAVQGLALGDLELALRLLRPRVHLWVLPVRPEGI